MFYYFLIFFIIFFILILIIWSGSTSHKANHTQDSWLSLPIILKYQVDSLTETRGKFYFYIIDPDIFILSSHHLR